MHKIPSRYSGKFWSLSKRWAAELPFGHTSAEPYKTTLFQEKLTGTAWKGSVWLKPTGRNAGNMTVFWAQVLEAGNSMTAKIWRPHWCQLLCIHEGCRSSFVKPLPGWGKLTFHPPQWEMSLMKGQPPFDTQLVMQVLCVRNGEKRPIWPVYRFVFLFVGTLFCCFFIQLSASGCKGLILRLCPVGDWDPLWAQPWL